MRAVLTPHPDSSASPVSAIDVSVRDLGEALLLSFEARGEIGRIALPPPAEGRADELWRSTCFEAFLADAVGDGYVEINLSPSSQWAAYCFTGYREGMRPLELPEPEVRVAIAADRLSVAAPLALAGAGRRIALSAVVEATDGSKSYWALAHPPGAPDFHHPSAFTLSLPEITS